MQRLSVFEPQYEKSEKAQHFAGLGYLVRADAAAPFPRG